MLIILDRDGVINFESHEYIKTPDEWIPIPKSLEAIAKLKQEGHQVVVATNQSGIARGLYTEETLRQIHHKMSMALADLGVQLDGIFYCPHMPEDCCECRKPKSGLYTQIANTLKADISRAISIGDSLRDLQAAMLVNAQPILVLTGNGKKTLQEIAGIQIPFYDDLYSAVTALLS